MNRERFATSPALLRFRATVHAVLGRAPALLFLGVALSACHPDGPEDPAIAAPGTGIPMGALGAVGVSFDAPVPTGAHTATPVAPHPRKPRSPPLPSSPFADPPGSSGDSGHDGGHPPIHPPPSKGTTL